MVCINIFSAKLREREKKSEHLSGLHTHSTIHPYIHPHNKCTTKKLTYISLMWLPFSLMAKRVLWFSNFFSSSFFLFLYLFLIEDLGLFFWYTHTHTPSFGTSAARLMPAVHSFESFSSHLIFRLEEILFFEKKEFLISIQRKDDSILDIFFLILSCSIYLFLRFFFLFSKFGFNFFLFFFRTMNLYRKILFFSTKYKKMDKKENNQPLPKESVTIESIFISISHIFCWSTTHTYIIPNLTLVSSFLSSWFLCMFFS